MAVNSLFFVQFLSHMLWLNGVRSLVKVTDPLVHLETPDFINLQGGFLVWASASAAKES